ncbi:hypothetical protein HK101_006103 [Irineochytrium annulatum]|nr:hypothetical protein HK101_006103 [Irineochytrium annulatum]
MPIVTVAARHESCSTTSGLRTPDGGAMRESEPEQVRRRQEEVVDVVSKDEDEDEVVELRVAARGFREARVTMVASLLLGDEDCTPFSK